MCRKNAVNILIWLCIFIVLAGFVFLMIKTPDLNDDVFFKHEGTGTLVNAFENSLYYGNGRFGGNFCIYFLMSHPVLRITTGCIVSIMLFVLSSFLVGKKKSFLVLSLFLFLTLDTNIFRQIYTSAASFYNYAVPISLLFLIVFLMEQKTNCKGIYFGVFILGFLMQLFAEHNTVINCLIALAMLLYKIFFAKESTRSRERIFLISTVLGAAVMFLGPRILGVADKMDGYRYFPILNIGDLVSVCLDNAYKITTYFMRSVTLTACLTLLCILLMKKKGKMSIICISVLGVTTALGIFLRFVDLSDVKSPALNILFVLVCVLYFVCVFITVFKCVTNVKERNRILGDIVFALMAFGVLLPVFPVGARCLFFGYALTVVAVIRIAKYTLSEQEIKKISVFLSVIVAVFVVFLGYVHAVARSADDERMEYLSQKISEGETKIVMPVLPYEQYFSVPGHTYVFDLYYYVNTPGDIEYEFISYDEWLKVK